MRRLCAALLAVWMICASALALDASGYPAYDRSPISANSLAGTIGTDDLLLEFDDSSAFSICDAGYIQACFFAMNAAGDSYVEIYLLIPENVRSGDIVDPTTAAQIGMTDCSVRAYEVIGSSETFYIAMQDGAAAYPQNSGYAIQIESMTDTGTAYAVRGAVAAMLAEVDELAPTGRMLVVDATFDFTLPKIPLPKTAPDVSAPARDSTASPVTPAFTLPPDYAKV